jgi:hypothetical protein
MTNPASEGLFHRLYVALKRGVLGRSTEEYLRQFTGTDAYWDRMLARHRGGVQPRAPEPMPPAPKQQ